MDRYFLDTSALVKRYHQESGSAEVERLFGKEDRRFFASRLALVEMHSCFARLVREEMLSENGFNRLILRLREDVASGLIVVAATSSQRLDEASNLLKTQGLTTSMRTLDAIHLATAQAIHGRVRIAAFVAADKQLLAVADLCGFTVLDVS
jgi:predicted nucleic acid-binding protein